MNRKIPWMQMLALCGAVYGFVQLATWGIEQFSGHQERLERNDSAYIWSYEARELAWRLNWKAYRDSERISIIEHKLKIQ